MTEAPARPPVRPHVVVVDDEEDLCELIALRLEHHGYRVSTTHSGRDALHLLDLEPADAMLLDLRLEEESGLEVLVEAQKRSLDVPILMLTAHGTIELALEATRVGAFGFITKPFEDRDLLDQLGRAVEAVRTRREHAARRSVGAGRVHERLIGASAAIGAVREVIARAAPSEATVLITGESGTGKEVAARTLHSQSGRRGRFVAINCGALPAELLESELFGYRRGAFTGAVRDKDGLFAAAHEGTLFLDEVGDAPASVQVKLLRVLEERCYVPLGSTEPRYVDVRVVAATNRDLQADRVSGRFREDLFYRLHVVPIHMPALRDRPEDVPLLAQLFLSRAVLQHRLGLMQLAPETQSLLAAHDWPGNVRELANVIEAAALLCTEDALLPAHLTAVLPLRSGGRLGADASALGRPRESAGSAATATGDGAAEHPYHGLVHALTEPLAELGALGPPDGVPPMREARVAFDRAYLTFVLRRCAGNVSAAARMAGRNRTDFYDLLRRYELDPLGFRGSAG
jgi:two-component system, NtrC family, response regulator GlrR